MIQLQAFLMSLVVVSTFTKYCNDCVRINWFLVCFNPRGDGAFLNLSPLWSDDNTKDARVSVIAPQDHNKNQFSSCFPVFCNCRVWNQTASDLWSANCWVISILQQWPGSMGLCKTIKTSRRFFNAPVIYTCLNRSFDWKMFDLEIIQEKTYIFFWLKFNTSWYSCRHFWCHWLSFRLSQNIATTGFELKGI